MRALRAPITITRLAANRLVWPTWLRLHGVRFGKGLILDSKPVVAMSEGGQIRLGSDVSLLSRQGSNPILIHNPCALSLRRAGARISIGDGSGLSGTVIVADTSVEIGRRVLIGANSLIIDTDGHSLLPELRRIDRNRGAISTPIVIGDDVFIGAASIILKGTVLGDGCVVNAGAVVSGAFPARSVIAGNPARVVGEVPVIAFASSRRPSGVQVAERQEV